MIPNQLWQVDITHTSDFGKLKYGHVTIDTFSGFLVATAYTREATENEISHCLHCFSILGVPNQIKTDNGTGYCSQAFETFCGQFNITYITGIACNSQGQSIEKQVLWNFKTVYKIKRGEM